MTCLLKKVVLWSNLRLKTRFLKIEYLSCFGINLIWLTPHDNVANLFATSVVACRPHTADRLIELTFKHIQKLFMFLARIIIADKDFHPTFMFFVTMMALQLIRSLQFRRFAINACKSRTGCHDVSLQAHVTTSVLT